MSKNKPSNIISTHKNGDQMQRTNEEMIAENRELVARNKELVAKNNKLSNTTDFAESIIETIREPLLVLDKNLRITTANENFCKNFKINKEEIGKNSIYEIDDKNWDIPELRELLETVRSKKESFTDFELSHEFSNIGPRILLLNARPIVNKSEEEDFILLIIEDITKWKKSDDQQARLASIVASSDDIIIGKTLDGTITSWNKSATKILGYSAKEACGKNIRLIIPPERQREENIIINRIKKGEVINHFETERLAKDGRKIPLSITVSPIKNNKGKIIGASKIARDISKQLEAAKKLRASEHRYRHLIDSSPSLIASFMGEDYIIEIANDAILEAWGKGKEVLGKPLFSVMPELIDQGFEEMIAGVFKTGKPFEAYEMPVKMNRNGKEELGYYNFIYYPERDVHGNIIGVVDIATEVTPQALINKKIKENEEKFRQMTNLLPDKITRADAQGNSFYFNKNWEDFFGWPPEKLKKEGLLKRLHPDELESVKQRWAQAVKTGEDIEMEIRLLDKNNNYKWHLSRAVALKNESGKIHTWITATTEIQTLKEEEKRKGDFLKMVSHELKTPMTSIKGYVQLLLNLCKPENKHKLEKFPLESSLERIDVQVTRLTRLIFEMLDLSRLEDQTLEFQRKPFAMNKLVKHTVEDIERTNTNYKIDVKYEDKSSVVGDEERISQVLINFITNAIKYSPADQHVEVRVHKTKGGEMAVSVRDHGIGIDKKDHKKIFERFYRVDGKNQETYSGFGIGLYLCNQIIKRHNGSIEVESKKGEGSVFTFILPSE